MVTMYINAIHKLQRKEVPDRLGMHTSNTQIRQNPKTVIALLRHMSP